LGENDTLTLSTKTVWQRVTLKTATAKNAPVDKAARDAFFETAAKSLESKTATSLLEILNVAGQRASIALNQNQPAQAEAILLEGLDVVARGGQQDEPNLLGLLAGAQALQKKYGESEANLRKVLENPASKAMNPNILTFALRTLASNYRAEGKFAEAEPHLSRLVALVLVAPGEGVQQTRADMFLLAENYANLKKYTEAEKAFSQLLDIQRRVNAPDAIQTINTASNVGWVRLQLKKYAEAEQALREASAVLTRTSPNSWERFNVESMFGASLAAQRKFQEAEPLLISGYEGMGRSKRLTAANSTSRFTEEQAGNAIIQLYADWSRPDKRVEWTEKLKSTKN
jgi:tetratricopeptide (TPR) repeat protein